MTQTTDVKTHAWQRSVGAKRIDRTQRDALSLPILPSRATELKSFDSASEAYRLVELYHSTKGEGTQAGVPMVFVRFSGCNLACDFCDTPYNRVAMTAKPDRLFEMIKDMEPAWVLFTGGEPMVQLARNPWIVYALDAAGTPMAIETNGMIYHECMDKLSYINISPKVYHTGPEKGDLIPVEKRINPKLLEAAQSKRLTINEIRHIICGPTDNLVELPEGTLDLAEWVTVSPLMYDLNEIPENWSSGMGHTGMYGVVDPDAFRRCMQIIADNRHKRFRLSVQVHKFVGVR